MSNRKNSVNNLMFPLSKLSTLAIILKAIYQKIKSAQIYLMR